MTAQDFLCKATPQDLQGLVGDGRRRRIPGNGRMNFRDRIAKSKRILTGASFA